ncbi:MAG: class II aldolase/adducin family protein [Candidatus Limnocylindrales bacterium]
MSASTVRETTETADLVRVVSALSHLGILDLRGSASVRLGPASIVTTPRPGPGVPVPAGLTIEDLVELDTNGGRVAGRWAPPRDILIDVELYRRRPEARAIVHAQPLTAMGFAAAGRALAPLTHTESALLIPHLPVIGHGEAADHPAAARALAGGIGDRPVALRPGHGSVAVGRSVAEAAMLSQQVEILARVNEIVTMLPPGPGGSLAVSPEDSARISGQKAPPADFQDYFDAVAESRAPGAPSPNPGDGSEAGLRQRVAAACHLLYHHGLIQHLEHVSVRLPDGAGFLITPRRHLGRLRPDEIAVVDMAGQWRNGPLEPPPFLWLHRDIFVARPEIDAIVHTHQLHARALVMAGRAIQPMDRAGAGWLAVPAATYEVPDLMFGEVHRRAALERLGQARILHEASHGTDYLAGTVEEATVGALHYERQARLWYLASRLGTPIALSLDVLDGVADEEPSDMDWWRYFRSEMPAAN